MNATSTHAQNLAQGLCGVLRRKILDKTGFVGPFDVDLKWVPDALATGNPGAASSGPSVFTVLEEQLGLKLESGRAPVDVLVIERIERPSEN